MTGPSFARQFRLRSRAGAVVLSLALLILLMLALLSLGYGGAGPVGQPGHLVSVSFTQDKGDKAKAVKAQTKLSKSAPPHPREPTPPTPEPTTRPPTSLIHLGRDEFAASDISRFTHKSVSDDDDSSAHSAATFGPGEGPGGARLYNARWYREPINAELRPFLGQGPPPGAWAMIACQTVEHFHVENCRELEEYPLGSGLARGLRRASWQFLVWPPRIDGKPQIGTWVRIRFDFTREGKEER